LHRQDKIVRELLNFRPTMFGDYGSHHVQALSSGGLYEALQATILEPLAHLKSARCQGFPRDRLIRIEIEDDLVRLLKGLIARPPRMQLQHTDLGKLDNCIRSRKSDVGLRLAGF